MAYATTVWQTGRVYSVASALVSTCVYIHTLTNTVLPATKLKKGEIVRDGNGFIGYLVYTAETT